MMFVRVRHSMIYIFSMRPVDSLNQEKNNGWLLLLLRTVCDLLRGNKLR